MRWRGSIASWLPRRKIESSITFVHASLFHDKQTKGKLPTKLAGRMASSVIASAFALAALAALAGCAAGPVAWLSRQDADSLPKLEAARTRSDHEEIATWYERQAASDDRQVDVHLRMGDFHASPDPGYSGAEFTGRCRILIFRHQRAAENNRALALLHIRLAGAAHE